MVLDRAIKLVVSRCYQNARISVGGKRCLFFYYEMRSKYIPSERRKVCRGRSDRPITVTINISYLYYIINFIINKIYSYFLINIKNLISKLNYIILNINILKVIKNS